ncbi:DUF6636 domain-containing protein [Nocardia sp. NPDC020380]|uniref:DUF6636 domain-containing protein n=1 Tax=Nocardia sp. NPDC020380 TaxID=3364309 RepID=UPI0037A601A9
MFKSRVAALTCLSATALALGAATAHADPQTIQFQSPTGNIACPMTGSSALCQIADFTYTPPLKPADCHGNWGDEFSVDAGATTQLHCHTDRPVQANAPVLAYGDQQILGNMLCRMTVDYVECRDNQPGGHGFRLSRDSYTLS